MSAFTGWNQAENEAGGVNKDFTNASSRTAALAAGRYSMISTQDCWWRRGGSTITATVDSADGTATGSHFLPRGTIWFFQISTKQATTKDQIAVIRDTADGKLFIRYEGP